MRTVNEANNVIKTLLPVSKNINTTDLKMIKWHTLLRTKNKCEADVCLLHNYVTGETIELTTEEYDNIESDGRLREELARHFFLISKDTDECELIDELRLAMRLLKNNEGVKSFKILTTTDCNARCYYCYELGIKKSNMTRETALSCVDYIYKKSNKEKVTLAWFGGEPMMNTEVIDIICHGLESLGLEYSSVMTSNGYLFDESLAKKAAEVWHLKNIQITLDGTRNIYNKVKAYKDAKASPYDRVLDNINHLTDAGVNVNIRLNVSSDSLEDGDNDDHDMFLLIDDLKERFKDNKKISVYVSGIFQELDEKGNDFEKQRKKAGLVKLLMRLQKVIAKAGLESRSLKSVALRTGGCMADNDSHRGIAPDGSVMKCEHHIFDRLVGHITKEDEDEDMLSDWKKQLRYNDICFECPVRPACYRLKNCPVSHICSKEERDEYVQRNERVILRKYLQDEGIQGDVFAWDDLREGAFFG